MQNKRDVIQCYRDENDRSVFNEPCPLTTGQLMVLYTMNEDENMAFQVTNREGEEQTVRFDYEWVNSHEGLAVLRSRIRYNFSRDLPSSESTVRRQVNEGLSGRNESRLRELNEMLQIAIERNRTDPDSETSGMYLVEEATGPGASFQCRGYVHHGTAHIGGPVSSEQECYRVWEPVAERFLRERGESRAEIERMRRQYSSGHLVRWHAAWDISGPEGTAVYVPLSGTVVLSDRNSSYGNHIRIRHDGAPREGGGTETVFTNYCHLSMPLVQENDEVFPGQAIGLMGQTGYASGTHLHFSVQNRDSDDHRLTTPHEVSAGVRAREWWQRVTGSAHPYHTRISRADSSRMQRDYRRSLRRGQQRETQGSPAAVEGRNEATP